MGDNAGGYGLDIRTNLGKLLDRMLEVEGDFELDMTDINAVYLPLAVAAIGIVASTGGAIVSRPIWAFRRSSRVSRPSIGGPWPTRARSG